MKKVMKGRFLYEEHKRGTRTFFVSAKRAKRQMPNKRERVVITYYIVPIHLLLSLLIIIIYIRGRIFLISYLAFGILSHRPSPAPTNVITPRLAA